MVLTSLVQTCGKYSKMDCDSFNKKYNEITVPVKVRLFLVIRDLFRDDSNDLL